MGSSTGNELVIDEARHGCAAVELGGYLDVAGEATVNQLMATDAAEQGLQLVTSHGVVCHRGADRFC